MLVSIFEKFNQVVAQKSISTIIEEIKVGTIRDKIIDLRNFISESNNAEYDKHKKTLPAFTPSGRFEGGRTSETLKQYSGFIILDIDDLSDNLLIDAKEKATRNHYTYACFISPSGKGLKIIIKTEASTSTHKEYFIALKKYYEEDLGILIDDSGKDITRLCFYSYDPEAYINEAAVSFNLKENSNTETVIQAKNPSATYEHCKRYTNKKKIYSEGNRNNYIHLLVNNCNRKGLNETDTLNFISRDFDLPYEEIRNIITSVYKNESEHNSDTYIEDQPKPPVIDLVEKFLSDRYEFRYNEVTGKLEYKAHKETFFQTISDYKENSLLREIQKARLKCNITALRGILGSDFCKIFNPFHNYYFGLPPWDASTDYITELARTITTTQQELWEYCFKKWIVAMVGTAIDNKTTNHTVIVFSGKQGLGKTTWMENLVPFQLKDHLFSGTINPNNKDTLIHLSECMLINLDELENLNKSEIGSLKELITKSHIRIRKAYGHNNESLPRRASFAGSVNTAQFLNDTTGSRRFLCFEVTAIDYQNNIDISKVYAQALHLFNTGFQYWFDKKEIDIINQNNEQYQMKSVEEEALQTWFDKPASDLETTYLNTTQIAVKLAEKTKIQVNNSSINLLGKALRKLGFERTKKNGNHVYAVKELGEEEVKDKSRTSELYF